MRQKSKGAAGLLGLWEVSWEKLSEKKRIVLSGPYF